MVPENQKRWYRFRVKVGDIVQVDEKTIEIKSIQNKIDLEINGQEVEDEHVCPNAEMFLHVCGKHALINPTEEQIKQIMPDVTVTLKELFDNDLWVRYCSLRGYNPFDINEENFSKYDKVSIPYAKANKWGLI